MSLINEIWKDITGYEGLYQVSSFGRVKSLIKKDSNGRIWPENIIKTYISNYGYENVTFTIKGNRTPVFKLHRLVAQSFIDNPDNKSTVNHKDGNKLNNRLDNLEWATHNEQMSHAKNTGLLATKERHGNYKGAIIVSDYNGGFIDRLEGQNEIIAKGYCKSKAYECANGKRKTHKGCYFKWERNLTSPLKEVDNSLVAA